MDLSRIWRHLVHSPRAVARAFPDTVLSRLERAVHASEKDHSGEIRIAIEGDLDLRALWRDQSPRERSAELFSQLGVWDTARNNGVLIHVLLADRDVEILADRGLASRVEAAQWEAVCRIMEAEFAAGHWEEGLLAGIEATGRLLAAHFPADDADRDELANRPELL